MEQPGVNHLMVCHSVPGRLRLKIKTLRKSPELRQILQAELARIANVTKAEIRPATGSVILFYDFTEVGADRLIELVARTLPDTKDEQRAVTLANFIGLARGWFAPGFLFSAISPGSLWNLAILSGFLTYSMARKLIFKLPLLQSPCSPAGIVALAGTLPLALKSLESVRNRNRPGLYPFLTAACVLAVAVGEALTAIEILWVLAVGTCVERLIAEKSRKEIRRLICITPDKTFVLVKGTEIEAPVDQVVVGDTVVVHEGERIPVDGTVLDGKASVDESHITGRWEPELRGSKDQVYAGARVVQGVLYVRCEKVGRDTYINRILGLVEDSLARRAEVEKKADLLASRLVRMGAVATAATFFLSRSLPRSLAVLLVMSCPCATVLATSTAIAAAIASAARRGILVKGGIFLETAQAIDTLVFDKTGTLTAEIPRVMEIVPRTPWQEPSQVLQLAANAEVASNHPSARALLVEARESDLGLVKDVRSEIVLGRGVRSEWNSDVVLVGNAQFMSEQKVDPSYFRAKAEKYQNAGLSTVYVARNQKLQGIIVVGNQERPECNEVLAWLKQDGIEQFSLISGDTLPTIRNLAESMGFDEYRAELLPQQKADYIDDLEHSGRRVMMVGDGLNDALALAKASVGVAMGAGGSEVAIEAADIALLNNDLQGLVRLRQLSHEAFAIIEQNFWIATLTNVAGAGLGMLGIVTPVMAGILHTVHSLGIMFNSSRLLAIDLSGSTS